jgi:hypothetical protein
MDPPSALLGCDSKERIELLLDLAAFALRAANLLGVVRADAHEDRKPLAAFPAQVFVCRHMLVSGGFVLRSSDAPLSRGPCRQGNPHAGP